MSENTPPPDPAGVPSADPPGEPTPDAPAHAVAPAAEVPEPAKKDALKKQNSTMMAVLSYGSMFLGFPAFILPMITKDDEFALYHARQAAAIYILWLILFAVIFAVSMVTCGFGAFLIPIIFLVYIPTIHGMILAAQGDMREPMMVFGLGDKMFGGIKVEPKD